MKSKAKWVLLSAAIVTTVVFAAENLIQSGFMTDYSQLTRIDDESADYRWVAEDVQERVADINAIMVDQPEVFIAADSPYQGAKPKHLDALAEAIRAGMIEALSEDFDIVEQPGPNVLYISMAITNLRLTKKKKSVLGYTPIGLVGGAVVGTATTDIAKKANLQDVVLEFEVFDSVTGDRLVAVIDHRGEGKEDPSSWEELEAAALAYGELARCRLVTARLPKEEWESCLDKYKEHRIR